MVRSLVLFVHITGVLALFAGLALEAFGAESAAGTTRRISGIGAALAVLSGFYLGARIGVLGDVWMRASYGAIVLMAAAGALAQRSAALRRISVRVRTTFALAVVFLMIAKPDAMVSVVVLGLAFGVSALVGLPGGRRQPGRPSSTPIVESPIGRLPL
jgi:hypothetical protein